MALTKGSPHLNGLPFGLQHMFPQSAQRTGEPGNKAGHISDQEQNNNQWDKERQNRLVHYDMPN